MRKRHRVVILAALVAALAVPLGFALSLESTPPSVVRQAGDLTVVAASAKSTPLFVTEAGRPRSVLPPLPDGAKLLVIGTALFGVAAVMRRTPQ